jgi:FkbM family methyltransferase
MAPADRVMHGHRDAPRRRYLSETIMNHVKKLSRRLFETLGYKQKKKKLAPLPAFFTVLKEHGFAPTNIIDIGANRGAWTRSAAQFFPDARYTLIEPQADLRVHVRDLIESGCKINWVHAGVSDTSGALPFTIHSFDSSSSFALTAAEAQAEGLKQVMVPVKTLNEIAAQIGSIPEMVKIDAEGFDLRVLSGGSELFGKTDFFLLEAAVFANVRWSQEPVENTFLAVVQRMADAGYRLFDITDLNRSPKHKVLWLCELAFIRNDSQLFDQVSYF